MRRIIPAHKPTHPASRTRVTGSFISRFRPATLVMTLLFALQVSVHLQAADALSEDGLNSLRRIVVQHNGRYKPMGTLAREVVRSITGTESYGGYDPLTLLIEWTARPEYWSKEPLIPIDNEAFRKHIKLPFEERFSRNALIAHHPLQEQIDKQMGQPSEHKQDALEKKIVQLNERLLAFDSVARFQQTIFFMPSEIEDAKWRPSAWLFSEGSSSHPEISQSWQDLLIAVNEGERSAANDAAKRLASGLKKTTASDALSDDAVTRELHYNAFAPYRKAWIIMLIGSAMGLLSLFVKRRGVDFLTTAVMFGGLIVLTYGIYLRWMIAERIPASNMFESLLFLSGGAALFTILGPLLFKNRVITLTGTVIAGVSLMLADMLPINNYIKPVMPVLRDTFWMALHVPVIMVSYAILAIAVLIAHAQVIGVGLLGPKWKHEDATDTLLYGYVFSGSLLLLIGILTGSMWAAASWGRYWGWDPKEVWSLVAFLGYVAILHTRVSREKVTMPLKLGSVALIITVFVICIKQLNISGETKEIMIAGGTFGGTAVAMVYFLLAKSRFATAAKSIIAFWLIIMTYVGVNYVLGTGLHSYGFGVGNVASKTMLVGGIDLAVLGVCAIVFYVRASLLKNDNTKDKTT